MTLNIEKWTGQFLDIASEMSAVVAELRRLGKNGPSDSLHALSLQLRDLTTAFAAHIISEVSRHRDIRKALAASERHFRTLAENLPCYLARYSPDAQVTYVNQALGTLLGYSTSEQVGRSPGEMFPDGRFDKYQHAIREVASSGSEERLDLSIVTADGRYHSHRLHIVPERDESGTVISVLTIGFDITTQRRWEKEQRAQYDTILGLNKQLEDKARQLGDARTRLDMVLQTLPDMVWMKDAEGQYLLCNHAFEHLTRRPERDILGKTDHALFTPELADSFRLMDAAAIEAGEIRISEEWVPSPDTGERALFETRKVPVFDVDGNLMGVLGVARDMTERKRIEEMLASRERQYRTLVEHSPDTVARYGKDLRLLYANPTFKALVAGGAALVGTQPSESPGGPHTALFQRKLVEVFEDGHGLQFELEWTGEGGGHQCTLIRLEPERRGDGTVETVLAVGRDITELCASREQIKRMAYYDPLTSLPNRTSFNRRLQRTFAAGSAHCSTAAVMMIDLDRFKGVNDTLGHAVGDELLREAAGRLSSCVRPCDTVARLGGDEFAVLLPDTPSQAVLEQIGRAIIDRFDDRFLLGGKEVFISCSIGIALYPSDSLQADDLMKYADSAMYLAKRAGRRCFRFYSKELTVDAVTRLTLESELRHAVKRGQLELHYQPKVLLEGPEVIGSEALLRWRRPDVGLVAPTEFISVAEETGLIVSLGEWVLREACRTATQWNAKGRARHSIAVNLSPRQFQTRDLARMVQQILSETGCRPEWLELEITESLLLVEDESVMTTLSAFRAMGLSIAIDDFGTGYSSLSYLARFPIDTLKIDKSFIRNVTTDQRHAELVKAILSIARCLGQEVVAEGVETTEQADFLKANGCHVAQGFLFGRPLSKRDMRSPSACLQAGDQGVA